MGYSEAIIDTVPRRENRPFDTDRPCDRGNSVKGGITPAPLAGNTDDDR